MGSFFSAQAMVLRSMAPEETALLRYLPKCHEDVTRFFSSDRLGKMGKLEMKDP